MVLSQGGARLGSVSWSANEKRVYGPCFKSKGHAYIVCNWMFVLDIKIKRNVFSVLLTGTQIIVILNLTAG